MAGGAFFAPSGGGDSEEQQSGGHAVQWVGTPGVRGPKWVRMPLLTVGMLGIQVGFLSSLNTSHDEMVLWNAADTHSVSGPSKWDMVSFHPSE